MDKLRIPTVSEEFDEKLEGNLNEEEISKAVDSMKSGKMPGPDGLPIDIYKKFKAKLLKPLMEMYLKAFYNGSLPKSMTGALITLLPKLGKLDACLKHVFT